MKRKIIVALIIIGISLVFLSEVKADEEITFSDENLEKMIREEIGKSAGPIYKSDLEEIFALDVYGKGIENLKGLEYCKNLRKLNLGLNFFISDISPLESLTNLTHLELSCNQISDISPLSNLTKLRELKLEDDRISDISPLKSLTNLTYLDLSHNQISDISPLVENPGVDNGDKIDIIR